MMKEPHTQILSNLLHDVGDAIASLNTIVVGLDAVENGYQKPVALDVSWNPDDRKSAARKSRKFVIESVLMRLSSAIKEHVTALSRLPGFADTCQKWSSDPSLAQKAADIYEAAGALPYLTSAAVLVVHWRNRLVHKSNARLTERQKRALRDAEEEIASNYKSLSVDCLLCHFEEQRPTLKDVSSLIAMTINLARRLDDGMTRNMTKDDLDALIVHYGLDKLIAKVKEETKPEKVGESILRVFQARAPLLLESYRTYYNS